MRQLSIILFLAFFCNCSPTVGNIETDIDQTQSKVLNLAHTGVMDTVTVVVHGQLIDLCSKGIVPATIKLSAGHLSYKTTADSNGNFRFFHIPAGQFRLSSDFPGYNKLPDTIIAFQSGDIWQLKTGLACKE
jgi:hypothetical protein